MILTIINGIIVLAMGILIIMLYYIIRYFEQLIVSFVEQNQEFYKNQKHLMEKANQHALDLRKLPSSVKALQRVTSKLDKSSSELNTGIKENAVSTKDVQRTMSKLSGEITKLKAKE